MVISGKNGVITEVSQFTTKDGSDMISITYSSGNEKELKKSYINSRHPLYNDIFIAMDDLIGNRIKTTIEVIE